MFNISFNKEPVLLNKEKYYYVIDALYLMDIKESLQVINEKRAVNNENLNILVKKVFPYCRIPFALYKPHKTAFSLEQIKKISNNIEVVQDSYFATDTGLLVAIATDLLVDFSQRFDYYELINSENGLLNLVFWEQMVSHYDYKDAALIIAPGFDSGFDFDGSGSYEIT